jgi:hypothetical protein
MKHFPLVLVVIAVLLATVQAYWSWNSRDDHIESIVQGRRLDACAEVGAAAADFAFRARAAQASFSATTYEAASEGPRALAKASYMAAYLLPMEASQDSATMRDLSQRIVAAIGERSESRVRDLLAEFDQVTLRVQDSCRVLIQNSRFVSR